MPEMHKQPSNSPVPRFAADAMLGRLATWLRLLGYDTFYQRDIEDSTLAALARREGRILLTRDLQLTKRRHLHSLLIESDDVWEQLRQVVNTYHLRRRPQQARCPRCNTPLRPLDHAATRERVPEYVWRTCHTFRECPTCGRVFWRGTHVHDMEARLAMLFDEHE
nr:Mut7-C RNAse domain-containing protein [Ardenticatena sp.]